jgi:hypothetical protein
MLAKAEQMEWYTTNIQPKLMELHALLAEAGLPWTAGIQVWDDELGEPDLLAMTANVGKDADQRLRQAVSALFKEVD